MTLAKDGLLGGRYRLIDQLASGGMGEVWRAEDEVLGRAVAVKVLRKELTSDPSFLARFRAEARHTAALSHPGIASVYDYGEAGESAGERTAYLVMELVDGEPLSTVLSREGRLDPPRALDIVGQTGLALQAAHDAGVVHRDVKPGNLLVRPDGTVKVTDFGIARAADAVPITQTGTVLGTAYYLSPEQASGAPVSPASDVYSLGVVAYEMLAGARPFQGSNPVSIAVAHANDAPPALPGDVPQPVRHLVDSALDKLPGRRPSSAGAFGATALALRDELRRAGGMGNGVVGAGAGALAAAAAAGPPPAAPRTRAFAAPPGATRLPGTPPSGTRGPVRRTPPPVAPRRTGAARAMLALLLALLGVVAVALLARSCDTTAQAAVPRVTGKDVADATRLLESRGFDVRTRSVSTGERSPGTVLAQAPGAGATVDRGSTVTLQVAKARAVPRVEVDERDFIGQDYAAVQAALQRLGLRVRGSYTGTGGRPGSVTSVTPNGSVLRGTRVVVQVVPQPPKEKDEGNGDSGKGAGSGGGAGSGKDSGAGTGPAPQPSPSDTASGTTSASGESGTS